MKTTVGARHKRCRAKAAHECVTTRHREQQHSERDVPHALTRALHVPAGSFFRTRPSTLVNALHVAQTLLPASVSTHASPAELAAIPRQEAPSIRSVFITLASVSDTRRLECAFARQLSKSTTQMPISLPIPACRALLRLMYTAGPNHPTGCHAGVLWSRLRLPATQPVGSIASPPEVQDLHRASPAPEFAGLIAMNESPFGRASAPRRLLRDRQRLVDLNSPCATRSAAGPPTSSITRRMYLTAPAMIAAFGDVESRRGPPPHFGSCHRSASSAPTMHDFNRDLVSG